MNKSKFYSLVSVIRHLFSFMWDSDWTIRVRIALSLLLTLAMTGLQLIIPFFMKRVVDLLSQSNIDTASFVITSVLVSYGAFWLIDQIVTHMRTLVIFKVLERSVRLLNLTVVERLLSLSVRFHVERKTGEITSYIQRAQSGVENVFWSIFSFLLPNSVEMVLVTILITANYGLLYGSPLIFITIGYAILNVWGVRKSIQVQEMYNNKASYASARMIDSLLNFETVKYFNNEKYEVSQINAALKDQEQAGVKRSLMDIYLQIVQAIIIAIGFTYLTWMSGWGVYLRKLTIGDFILINGYLLRFIMPLNYFGYTMIQIRKGLYNIQSAFNLLMLKPEIQDAVNAADLAIKNAEIIFEQVSFGYTSDRLILKNFSLTIPSGKTIALVGPTGSGKSTIARLIFRLYDVQFGSVKINGHDIRAISQKCLHQAVGVIPQETVLFNESLYYNVSYGKPDAPKEEVEEAMRLACLNPLIEALPNGYNTVVGERGLKLSGGEKQRVSIARVLLKKPVFFIFDEATSSLDTLTAQEIQNNLAAISRGITTLIIAHRLSMVTHADQIIVFDQGVILEQGSHEQLLGKGGLYTKLWYGQQRTEEPILTRLL